MKSTEEPQCWRRKDMKLNLSDAVFACTVIMALGGIAYVATTFAAMF